MAGRNKLPRILSLKSRVEITDLLRNGKRYSGTYFTLAYQPADDFRYGVFLSKRHGPAVFRNRIKRLFREAVRTGGRQLLGNGRVAILPRSIDKDTGLEAIKSDVCRVFKSINPSG